MEVKRNAFLRMIDFIASAYYKFIVIYVVLNVALLIMHIIHPHHPHPILLELMSYVIAFVLSLIIEPFHRLINPRRVPEGADKGWGEILKGFLLLYLLLPFQIGMIPFAASHGNKNTILD